MATNFDRYNQAYNGQALAKEVKEINENGNSGTREEVPFGMYEVAVEKLFLTETKENPRPMISAWFKIVGTDRKGQYIFMNRVVDTAFKIHLANEFLKSLGTTIEVNFDGDFNHYGEMIERVLNDIIVCGLEYALDYSQNSKGFTEYKIKEVFETK